MKSEQINELASALSKVQGSLQPAIKDSDNPFFKSKYADLSSIWMACHKLLSENGLAVSQVVQNNTLETILMHSSGQFISSSYPISPVKADPQSFGSAITYARRYALAAIVGVCTIDDDGNEASLPPGAKPTPEAPRLPARVASPSVNQGVPNYAPKPQSTHSLLSDNPGAYTVTVGKFKGKQLAEIDIHELDSYLKYIEKQSKETGKGVSGGMAEFFKHAEDYMNNYPDLAPKQDDDIPF